MFSSSIRKVYLQRFPSQMSAHKTRPRRPVSSDRHLNLFYIHGKMQSLVVWPRHAIIADSWWDRGCDWLDYCLLVSRIAAITGAGPHLAILVSGLPDLIINSKSLSVLNTRKSNTSQINRKEKTHTKWKLRSSNWQTRYRHRDPQKNDFKMLFRLYCLAYTNDTRQSGSPKLCRFMNMSTAILCHYKHRSTDDVVHI